MAQRGYSDSYLQALWRKAVKGTYHNRCACSGVAFPCGGALEAHHVVRRGKGALRNDFRNGVALCTVHHKWADTWEGRDYIESIVDCSYLRAHDVTLPVRLHELGCTRVEFDRLQRDELTAVIRRAEEGSVCGTHDGSGARKKGR